jgi:hypothetical protein
VRRALALIIGLLAAGCMDDPEPTLRIISIDRLEGAAVPVTSIWRTEEPVTYRLILAMDELAPPPAAGGKIDVSVSHCPWSSRRFSPEVAVEAWSRNAHQPLGDLPTATIQLVGPRQYWDNDYYRCGVAEVTYRDRGRDKTMATAFVLPGPPRAKDAPITD